MVLPAAMAGSADALVLAGTRAAAGLVEGTQVRVPRRNPAPGVSLMRPLRLPDLSLRVHPRDFRLGIPIIFVVRGQGDSGSGISVMGTDVAGATGTRI